MNYVQNINNFMIYNLGQATLLYIIKEVAMFMHTPKLRNGVL